MDIHQALLNIQGKLCAWIMCLSHSGRGLWPSCAHQAAAYNLRQVAAKLDHHSHQPGFLTLTKVFILPSGSDHIMCKVQELFKTFLWSITWFNQSPNSKAFISQFV